MFSKIKSTSQRVAVLLGLGGSAALLAFSTASAAPNYILDGGTMVHPGNNSANAIELHSTQAGESGGLGLLDLPSTLKVSDLTGLSFDYRTTGGDCTSGSPRYIIGIDVNSNGQVDNDEWAAVHFMDTNCTTSSWTSSSNLLDPSTGVVALNGLDPSLTFPSTVADLNSHYGADRILKIDIEVDGFVPGTEQHFQFDNAAFTTASGTTTYTFDDDAVVDPGSGSSNTAAPIKTPTSINTGGGWGTKHNTFVRPVASVLLLASAGLLALAVRRQINERHN